jgi:glycosyltransferase involved in cell wall biosynthesis
MFKFKHLEPLQQIREMDKKVIVIATSKKTKGGITSVIQAYSRTKLWSSWNCYWLETHIDKSFIIKIYYVIKSLIHFILIVHSYQIVHIHFSEPSSALRKSLFLKIAKFFNKIVIAHFHSFSTKTTIDGDFQNTYYKFFLASDKIIVLSNIWKNWIIRKWPEFSNKVEVIFNPCPIVSLDKTYSKSKTILYAGALISRKGYSDLINGFAMMANRNREWKLVLAGNGEIEKAKQLANDLKIENQVDIIGWVAGEEKDLLFKSANIFCLPSYAEGFPMAVLDAWAYGLPVITTLVGGLPDILIDGENALIIVPGDSEGISIAIEKLINDEDLQKRLSDGSLKLSETIFSLDNITNQVDNMYLNLFKK